MIRPQLVRTAGIAGLSLGIVFLTGTLTTPQHVKAQGGVDEGLLVKIGFEIAPVPLNMKGKIHDLVGLGSFIVNGQGDCNGCHTSGGPPNFNYAAGGNPYFGQPTKTDPTAYLDGGTDFGPAVPFIPGVYPPAEYGSYVGPDIITRNLTPDKNGRPEGGHTLAEFKQILRTGKDFDGIHPTCQSPADPNVALGICIPPPVVGSLLQVMPWPVFHNMTDHQIEAIYEYLSAIPCIDNSTSTPPVGAPDELRNDCGDPAVKQDAASSSVKQRR